MARVKLFNSMSLEQKREYPAHSGPVLLAQFLNALTCGDLSTPEQAAALVERCLSYEMGTHTKVMESSAPRLALPSVGTHWQAQRSLELKDADAVLEPIWVIANTRIDGLQYAQAHKELASNGWLEVSDTEETPQYFVTQRAHDFMDVLFAVVRITRAYVDAYDDPEANNLNGLALKIKAEAAIMCEIMTKNRGAMKRSVTGLNVTLNTHIGQLPIWNHNDIDQHARRTAQNFGQRSTAI
ncbi:hypothetical protein [Deinococcus marmoris]|uniref:hypothetical protein n=1 Tax=Deinococcus marmoris TaxID=249408 RepID=UPI000497A64F|nr:hypothetical protein [Deinococcus marmoris]